MSVKAWFGHFGKVTEVMDNGVNDLNDGLMRLDGPAPKKSAIPNDIKLPTKSRGGVAYFILLISLQLGRLNSRNKEPRKAE